MSNSNPPPIFVFGLMGVVIWVAVGPPPASVPLPAAINAVLPSPLMARASNPCSELLTSAQVREVVKPFQPPPGHSYQWARIPVNACRQLSDHVRADGTRVQRHLYESEDGLKLAVLVEKDRVIGLQYFPEE